MSAAYGALVRHILWEFDTGTEIASKSGGSPHRQGENAALHGLLHWLQGYEGTDLDGLRERFKEGS